VNSASHRLRSFPAFNFILCLRAPHKMELAGGRFCLAAWQCSLRLTHAVKRAEVVGSPGPRESKNSPVPICRTACGRSAPSNLGEWHQKCRALVAGKNLQRILRTFSLTKKDTRIRVQKAWDLREPWREKHQVAVYTKRAYSSDGTFRRDASLLPWQPRRRLVSSVGESAEGG
jgi:hypothetical protein